ncbi:hypothetical protein [Ktedonobacter robiniae]|uniref:Uncharacterized protein n=1 Tax=Ktedonobacter robiniae TaxID=2778365 RepID=A0ABQ3V0X9_9CHLR|nr:hypothetical protein [Ktedonobacter robiniae]GHO58618.1 hypothetical protein KSB_70930 [Ktedonobacter robiniae]
MKNSSVDSKSSREAYIQDQQRYSVGELLALTVPLVSVVASVAWATATYFIVREVQRAHIEIARIEAERK